MAKRFTTMVEVFAEAAVADELLEGTVRRR